MMLRNASAGIPEYISSLLFGLLSRFSLLEPEPALTLTTKARSKIAIIAMMRTCSFIIMRAVDLIPKMIIKELLYLIRINFGADKISRNFIRELRAEGSCAKINPRKKFKMKNVHARPYFLGNFKSFRVYLPWVREIKSARNFSISRVRENLSARKFSDFAQPECAKICPRENIYE